MQSRKACETAVRQHTVQFSRKKSIFLAQNAELSVKSEFYAQRGGKKERDVAKNKLGYDSYITITAPYILSFSLFKALFSGAPNVYSVRVEV